MSFTVVKNVLEIPYNIHGLSVNSRNAIQGRSEREGLFVTDVAESSIDVMRGRDHYRSPYRTEATITVSHCSIFE